MGLFQSRKKGRIHYEADLDEQEEEQKNQISEKEPENYDEKPGEEKMRLFRKDEKTEQEKIDEEIMKLALESPAGTSETSDRIDVEKLEAVKVILHDLQKPGTRIKSTTNLSERQSDRISIVLALNSIGERSRLIDYWIDQKLELNRNISIEPRSILNLLEGFGRPAMVREPSTLEKILGRRK